MAGALSRIESAGLSVIGPKTQSITVTHGTLKYTREKTDKNACITLARQKGWSDEDIYAVARCISSEVGSKTPIYQLALGEIVWRVSRASKWNGPARMLTERTTSAYSWTQGWYGEQHGRWASTRQQATERNCVAAREAKSSNITKGGITFFDPHVQNSGKQGSRTIKTAVEIIENWGKGGSCWVGPIPGINPYRLMIMSKNYDTINYANSIKIARGQTVESSSEEIAKAEDSAAIAIAGVVAYII